MNEHRLVMNDDITFRESISNVLNDRRLSFRPSRLIPPSPRFDDVTVQIT